MRCSLAIISLSSALALAGCSGTPGLAPVQAPSGPDSAVALEGTVRGGQQPIAGASVYLFAANSTGPGAASVSLLTSSGNTSVDSNGNYYVTTSAMGEFMITGDYACPSPTSQVYLYAIGGNPGLAAGTNNTAAGVLSGLGSCGSLTSSTAVSMDEISTVATAYSIAGFATDPMHVSSAGTAFTTTAIANAFATINNIDSMSTGQARATTPAGNGTVPQSEINTLANILAACISTNGAVTGPSSPTPCYTLFSNAMSGGKMPSDTATAAINIAHNPGANIASLFALPTGTPPFQPSLTSAPNDFTISITYTGGGMENPGAPAVDSSGNIWVGSTNAVCEFSSDGVANSSCPFTASGQLNRPGQMAFDSSGNLWIANTGGNNLIELNPAGEVSSGSPFTVGSQLSAPLGIAFDSSGNGWVTSSSTNTISEFNADGAPVSSSAYSGGGLDDPTSIAVGASGNIWVTNQESGANSISEFNSSGVPISGSPIKGGGLDSPDAIAVDPSGNLWVENSNGSLSEFNSAGAANPYSPFSNGGADAPSAIAIDGAGNIWVEDSSNAYSAPSAIGSLSEFSSSGAAISGQYGYISSGTDSPLGLAIDGSGNIWVASSANNTLTEFVGVAAPVITPAVTALQSASYESVTPVITFSTSSLPSATVNSTYSANVTASGGAGPLTYAVTSGSLPAGITMSPAGALTGTPTATGTSNFTVTASDAYGDSGSESLSIVVDAAAYEVTLTWDAPAGSSDPVVGYNIYRAPSGSTTYSLLNATVNTPTEYTDTTVASGSSYSYYVESVDAQGNQSVPSNILSFTIP